jgi:hypothetical protein
MLVGAEQALPHFLAGVSHFRSNQPKIVFAKKQQSFRKEPL